MTVCLAAILSKEKTIAFVSDQLLTLGGDVTSLEGFFKIAELDITGRWLALFSGDALSFTTLKRRIREQLGPVDPGGPGAFYTKNQVAAACEAAYKAEIRRSADAYLSNTGLSVSTFLLRGRRLLPESVFRDTWSEIMSMNLGDTELLVGGFDGGRAHLFHVDSGGNVQDLTDIGYYVIGHGWQLASAVIHALPTHWHHRCNLSDGVYHLCVAKFTAERDPYVGRSTAVFARSESGPLMFMSDEDTEKVRSVWMRDQSRVPNKARTLIRDNLVTAETRLAQRKAKGLD